MSELEHCRLAHDGKLKEFIEKIQTDPYEDLPRKKDSSGRTALHWACAGGKKEIVDYLVKEFAVPLDDSDDTQWTPLMIASSVGSVGIVRFLLDVNCDVNHETDNKQRPLHYACSKNHPAIAAMLLEKGADINAADKFGSTALHRAVSKGNISIIELLLNQRSLNVNAADCEGNTPLHIAAEETKVDIAKMLLKHDANPNYKNKEGQTPIDKSCGGLENIIAEKQY